MHNIQAFILAAGKSSSLKTDKTKLLEKICGQEIILYATRLLESLSIATTVIVGYQKDVVIDTITKQHGSTINFVTQDEQHGTAHAIAAARNSFEQEHILVMHGDVPLVTADIINELYAKHIQSHAAISFVTAHNDDPSGRKYSKVAYANNTVDIKESYECNDATDHYFINAGIYIITKDFLKSNIDSIKKNQTTNEYHFSDLVNIASKQKLIVSTTKVSFNYVRSIDTFQELWAAEQIKRAELITHWMNNGVRFAAAQTVHIDLDVIIGAGSFIASGVHLQGATIIGNKCFLQEFCLIKNSTVQDDTIIHSHCIIKDSHIGTHAQVGPFAHVLEQSTIGAHAIIGNFMEVKRSTIGNHTKAKHLSYLGDAHIGSHVNIGAGTITCNHDGSRKHTTTIEDGAYVGSNNTLVAPVTIGNNAFTAAGSTITDSVPKDALAIGRARQVNKLGYAVKLRNKTPNRLSYMNAVKNNKDTKVSEKL